MQRANSRLFTLATIGLLSGCAGNPPPGTPRVITISGKLPTLSPLPETKELQQKGGLQISVAPVPYELVPSGVSSDRAIQPSFMEKLGAPDGWQNMRFVERTTSSVLTVQPEALRFRITINNQLPRVFRGGGTVVQFNIAGKLLSVSEAGYADLVNVIVPPRTQQQIEIYGPPIAVIPEQTTVGLFLYDVVTKTDAAGNVTEKQNFEWYFNYAVQTRDEPTEVKTQRLWVR